MLLSTLFCVYILSSVAYAAKILGIFMTPSYSHQIVFQPIWKELSLRGHEVTVYTPSPINDKFLVNLTEYDLGFSRPLLQHIDQAGQDFDAIFSIYEKLAETQLSHAYMQDLIKNVNNDTFDLLLVEYLWSPMYAFKEIYKVPMVGITSLPLTIRTSDALGMDKHPILDPDVLLQFSYATTLKQRILSWAYKWISRIAFQLKFAPKLNAQIRRYFGNDMKSCLDLTSEVSIVLGNYNFALQNVKPTVANFIPISAIHVQPQKMLPLNLSSFLENQKTDVIYFSLGTNVRLSKISRPILTRILSILGQLPYTIIWKCDPDDLPENLPKNFFVRNWFPQQDLLGHLKVKLFITQGGLQSIDEALSRKVPMLIIPFLGDQKTNADRCVRLGIAESVNFATFTNEEFHEKITKLLTNPSYQKNINKQSMIASDQPLKSLNTAIFWIEYVLRHEGAYHLRYGAIDLPFYQYYLLDIYLFIGVIVGVFYYIFSYVYFKNSQKTKRKKEKYSKKE